MKKNYVATGIFVVLALVLVSGALFLIGDRHKAFAHHVDFYTELANVNGIVNGSKVRVSGLDAGRVSSIEIPSHPAGKFRLKLHVDEKLHNLIRQDSLVTVETDGIVGDKFLLIHDGSDQAEKAAPNATLPSKEPIELSALIDKLSGVMDQTNATIGDVRTRANATLDSIRTTVDNTNGLVTSVRSGKGTVGMLLSDQATADKVKSAVGNVQMASVNVQQASANLNQVSLQARQITTDFQSRDLFQKTEDTLNNAKDASHQLDMSSQQLNTALADALGPDRTGQNAADNLRETLSNVNLATSNIADDTEALKHEFFFRGFFKKRGYYSLNDLSPDAYRSASYFQNARNQRVWLSASDAFEVDASGHQELSVLGQMHLDQVIGEAKNHAVGQPIVIEGYSSAAQPSDQMVISRSRAILVSRYLEKRYHLNQKDVATIGLNDTAPAASGKTNWDGVGIVFMPPAK